MAGKKVFLGELNKDLQHIDVRIQEAMRKLEQSDVIMRRGLQNTLTAVRAAEDGAPPPLVVDEEAKTKLENFLKNTQ